MGIVERTWTRAFKGGRRPHGGVLRRWAAAVLFGVSLGWFAYLLVAPDPPARRPASIPTHELKLARKLTDDLGVLPDLTRLSRAAELPDQPGMVRDLFLFESVPAVQVFIRKLPEAPAPTPAELEAMDREFQRSTHPIGIRYLGYLSRPQEDRLGAFVRDDQAVLLTVGAVPFPGWALATLDERAAVFRNQKYADLTYALAPVDAPGGPADPAVFRP